LNKHIFDSVPRLLRVDRSKYRLRDWSVETNTYTRMGRSSDPDSKPTPPYTFLETYRRWYWGTTRRWIIQCV